MTGSRKAVIIDMIEQGHSNTDIVQAVRTTKSYVCYVRYLYNKAAGVNAIRSPALTKPKQGTQSRLVYNYFMQNRRASLRDASEATGADTGVCCAVRKRYFEKVEGTEFSFQLKHVSASELELVE